MGELIPVDGLLQTYVPRRICQNCATWRDGCTKADPPDGTGKACSDFMWGYTVDEYETAGAMLLDYVQQAAIAMGALVEWGYENIRPLVDPPLDNETAWCRWCANLWNTTRPTLVKAWGLWRSEQEGTQIPADLSHSAAYRLIAAIADPKELQMVLDKAADENWSEHIAGEMILLRKLGFLDTWERPHLVKRGEYILERRGKRYRRIARVLSKAPGAGLHLLLSRGHVHQEEEAK